MTVRRLLALAILALLLAAPAAAQAAPASLVDVEDEVMCVTCNVPLNIAESPQADRERAFIRARIDRGATKRQVKEAMKAEYGPKVLALPDSGGFGITAYAIPIALVVVLLAVLAFFVPRWRRRGGTDAPARAAGPALSSADARRLDEDLARYEA